MGVPEGVAVVYVCPMHPEVVERGARQLPEVRDEAARPSGRRDDVRVPHASRGDERQARPLPQVRHEAPAGQPGRCGWQSTITPRAPREHERPRSSTTGTARATRHHRSMATARSRPRARARSRHRAGNRVGRRHGRGQPDDDSGQHALEARRPRDRAPRTPRSTGPSASATRSSSASSTRWTQIIRCRTRSTSTGPAAS